MVPLAMIEPSTALPARMAMALLSRQLSRFRRPVKLKQLFEEEPSVGRDALVFHHATRDASFLESQSHPI